jgi:hypothetical protein
MEAMSGEELKVTYDMTHNYLEVARAAFMPVHLPKPRAAFIQQHGHNPLTNTIISIVSISALYSYLAIESYINYQLYRIWDRRHDRSPEAQRFLRLLGDPAEFLALKNHKKVRELPERIKTLYSLLDYQQLHERKTKLWQDFKELVETSRHFFVHPIPQSDYFQRNMWRIGEETQAGVYVDVASAILRDMHEQSGLQVPAWLEKNTLFSFRGADVIVGRHEE